MHTMEVSIADDSELAQWLCSVSLGEAIGLVREALSSARYYESVRLGSARMELYTAHYAR